MFTVWREDQRSVRVRYHPDDLSRVYVSVGGETFIALSAGLQAALWRLGGVPEEHRTDSLSAAFNNLAEQETLIFNAAGRSRWRGPLRPWPDLSHE